MRFPAGAPGTLVRPAIGLALIAAIFAFLGWSLASNWSELQSEDVDIEPMLLVASAVPLLGAIVVLAFAWRQTVSYLETEARPGLSLLPKVFLFSWVGRYVPGKIAYVAGRFLLGRSAGFPAPVLVGSMAYEAVLMLAVGSAFATVTVLPTVIAESETIWLYLTIPILAIGAASVLHPRILRWALQIGSRVLGRDIGELEWVLSTRDIVRLAAMYVIAFCLSGGAFYLLIISITPYPARFLPLAVGAFALAGVLGLVSVVTPAGIGVREGIIVAILQFTMPLELAVLVSLVARVWATVVDLLLVGGVLAYDYLSGDRMLATAIRGNGDTLET